MSAEMVYIEARTADEENWTRVEPAGTRDQVEMFMAIAAAPYIQRGVQFRVVPQGEGE
jgi:hypothetical protein